MVEKREREGGIKERGERAKTGRRWTTCSHKLNDYNLGSMYPYLLQ